MTPFPCLVWAPLLLACAGAGTDAGTSNGLPPEQAGDGGSAQDDGGADDGTGGEYTGGSTAGGPEAGDDEVPTHSLELRQEGSWELSPYPGPYDSMSGELVVTEILDGEEALPACSAVFSLTGYATDETCSDCQVAFEVLHYLAEDGGLTEDDQEIPGLDACLAPDLPDHEDTWVMGLSDDGSIIYKQTGLGGWVPWFDAEQRLDSVDYAWTATVAVEGDEEEE